MSLAVRCAVSLVFSLMEIMIWSRWCTLVGIYCKDYIQEECQHDRCPRSVTERLQNLAGSQGWAMCLHGAQQSHPHYPSNKSVWKMDAGVAVLTVVRSILPDRGGRCGAIVRWEGGGVTPGLSCPQLLYVCLISQFISRAWLSGEPSAPAIHQGLSPSHHSWEMRPKHSNSISPISPGYTARQLSQPGSTLFRTQRDNKTISANQKQLLSPYTPAGCCHSLRLPLGYAAVLKSHWLTLRFFFVLSHFLPQMKHFFFSHQLLFCGWIAEILICNHGVAQTLTTAVSCTLTLRLLWYDGIQDMMNKISVIMITHE